MQSENCAIRVQESADIAKPQQRVYSDISDASTVVTPSKPVQNARRVLNPTPPPRVKSSLKLRPSLNRTNSEPVRKCVHFSTTNLCDVRPFNRSQRPSQVSKRFGNPYFFLNGTKETSENDGMKRSVYNIEGENEEDEEDDDDDVDDDDDDDEEEEEEDEVEDDDELYRVKIRGNKSDSNHDFLSVALGLDDDYDEDGICRVPQLKVRPHRSSKNKTSLTKKESSDVSTGKPKGWTMLTPGFVPHSNVRIPGNKRPNVYLENIQFMEDAMQIRATVLVRNISFHKVVAVRYTLNAWKSIHESQGTWSDDVRKFDRENNFDRFDVIIPLDIYSADFINNATIEMCVKYDANGTESWDNNGGRNYNIYLRNQQLSKPNISTVPSKTNDSTVAQTAISKSRNFSCPQIRRATSADSLTLHDMSADEQETYDDSESFTSDVFRDSGLPHTRGDSIKLKNPFGNRYSFKTSFNGIENSRSKNITSSDHRVAEWPQNSHSGTPEHTVRQVLPSGFNTALTDSTAASDGQLFGRASHPAVMADSSNVNTGTVGIDQSWESDSYKDFVSKYCFYTPQSIVSKAGVSSSCIAPALGNSSSRSPTPTSFHD